MKPAAAVFFLIDDVMATKPAADIDMLEKLDGMTPANVVATMAPVVKIVL
jgi:hypothetical protein